MNATTPGMKIDAAELARRAAGTWLTPPGEVAVTTIEIDSRLCVPGTLFAALPGQHADGHDYIAAAVANDAAAALVSRRRSRPRLRTSSLRRRRAWGRVAARRHS